MAAKPGRLANPEFAKAVAEAYVDGMSRSEMAQLFDCCPDTITNWVRDPRVQAHSVKMAQDRVTRITRRIDSEIELRLQNTKNIDTEVLLKIRKEFLDRSLKVDLGGSGKDNADTINEAVSVLETNPALAKQFKELIGGSGE